MADNFPYSGADSLFPVVKTLIKTIADLPKRDWSPTVSEAIITVDAMGKENGFGWLWTAEERAVASALKQIFSGQRTAHYGWRLYAGYRRHGRITTDGISY